MNKTKVTGVTLKNAKYIEETFKGYYTIHEFSGLHKKIARTCHPDKCSDLTSDKLRELFPSIDLCDPIKCLAYFIMCSANLHMEKLREYPQPTFATPSEPEKCHRQTFATTSAPVHTDYKLYNSSGIECSCGYCSKYKCRFMFDNLPQYDHRKCSHYRNPKKQQKSTPPQQNTATPQQNAAPSFFTDSPGASDKFWD
jgi:hypothetical protein